MSNHIMQVTFGNSLVRCETENSVVSLTDLFFAGNQHRMSKGKPAAQLAIFKNSKGVKEYMEAASKEWGIPESELMYTVGKGAKQRTMAHVSIAVLAAEYLSPEFHARIHKILITERLLENRQLGAIEFKALNMHIDQYLKDREDKDSNRGVYIQVAKVIRENILGDGAKAGDWNKASGWQTELRLKVEESLCDYMSKGFITDYPTLKKWANDISS